MADKKYKIAIMIPNYNTPKRLLEECFNSVIRQNIISDIKVFIFDDGSSLEHYNELLEIVNSLKQKIDFNYEIFRSENRRGISSTRQKGLEEIIRQANCEYLFFLDSDDEILNANSLEETYKFIKENHYDFIKGTEYITYTGVPVGNKHNISIEYGKATFENPINALHSYLFDINFIKNNELYFANTHLTGNEDSLFNVVCHLLSENYNGINTDLYKWKRRGDSNFILYIDSAEDKASLTMNSLLNFSYIFKIIKGREYSCEKLYNYFMRGINAVYAETGEDSYPKYNSIFFCYTLSLLYKNYFPQDLIEFIKKNKSKTFFGILSNYWNDKSRFPCIVRKGDSVKVTWISVESTKNIIKNGKYIQKEIGKSGMKFLTEEILNF